MPGLNTTGQANTDDYNVGRGKVYLATLDSNGIPQGYRFLGNAPEFNISMEAETLTHQSSTGGLKVTDKEVLISQTVNLSLTLDEINFQNMALFFSGATASYANSGAVAGVVGVANLLVSEQGRWYDLYKSVGGAPTSNSNDDRIYDIGALTVEGGTAVEGTDYEVDLVMGRIFVIEGSSVLAVSVTPYDVVVAAQGNADAAVAEVRALTQSSVTGALKFVSENPAAGDKQTEFQFHSVSLKAEGDFGLISDEFTTMGLTGVAESNVTAGGASSPTLTIRYANLDYTP
jgi:hypothetical protein